MIKTSLARINPLPSHLEYPRSHAPRGNTVVDLAHPNTEKYSGQSIFIILISIKNYVYIVPYAENETTIFLKTIIPSRKMNKRYNKVANND